MNNVASEQQIKLCKLAAIDRYEQHGIPAEVGAQLFDLQLTKLAEASKGWKAKAKDLGDAALKALKTPEGVAAAGGAVAGGTIGAVSAKKNKGRAAVGGAVAGAGAAAAGTYAYRRRGDIRKAVSGVANKYLKKQKTPDVLKV